MWASPSDLPMPSPPAPEPRRPWLPHQGRAAAEGTGEQGGGKLPPSVLPGARLWTVRTLRVSYSRDRQALEIPGPGPHSGPCSAETSFSGPTVQPGEPALPGGQHGGGREEDLSPTHVHLNLYWLGLSSSGGHRGQFC